MSNASQTPTPDRQHDPKLAGPAPREAGAPAPRRPRTLDCSEGPDRAADSRIAATRLPGRQGR